jgi:hypothetical protein
MNMASQIVCPNCKRTISGSPILEDAESGKGLDARILLCECGEKLNYWQISSLLREQRTVRRRLQVFLGKFSQRRG